MVDTRATENNSQRAAEVLSKLYGKPVTPAEAQEMVRHAASFLDLLIRIDQKQKKKLNQQPHD